jgi:hypothetical protein
MKAIALFAALVIPSLAWSQTGPFPGADLTLGQKLISEHQCAQCHAQKVGGNGSACAPWWSDAAPN